jgi:AGCS family alanine or glycine:cation symporter
MVFIGTTSSADVVWNFGSAGVGAMAWFNVIVILFLTKPGIATLKDYEAQKKLGLDPVFVPERIGVKGAELWHKIVARSYSKELEALKAATKDKTEKVG